MGIESASDRLMIGRSDQRMRRSAHEHGTYPAHGDWRHGRRVYLAVPAIADTGLISKMSPGPAAMNFDRCDSVLQDLRAPRPTHGSAPPCAPPPY